MAEILRKGRHGALTCCCRATCSRSFEACFRMASIGRRRSRRSGSVGDGVGVGMERGGDERSESGRRKEGEMASGLGSRSDVLSHCPFFSMKQDG